MALNVQKRKMWLKIKIPVVVLRATGRGLVTTARKNLHQSKLLVTIEREFPVMLHSSDVKIMSKQIFVLTEQIFD
jgi:hypothetical protein